MNAEPAVTGVPRPGIAFAGIFTVTFCGLIAVGAVLPVLPRYVDGPLGAGKIAVGIVIGAYAITGLLLRPFAGRFADRSGRRPTVLIGSLLMAAGGFLYLLPLGVGGLIAARLVLGAGEGTVFTAGSAWIVDLAPPERRGRVIGLYGLAVWAGLSIGPLFGELIQHGAGYTAVWIFAGVTPLIGALVATRVPDPFRPSRWLEHEHHSLIAHEAVMPGAALALGSIGYAAVATFVVLHLDDRGVGHGALVFGAFATMVVLTRLVGGDLPDRVGPARRCPGRGGRLDHDRLRPQPPGRHRGSPGDGRRLLAALPLALADRRQPGVRSPARRGAGHLHRLLRRRRRRRRAAGRAGSGIEQLRGLLPPRGLDRARLGDDDRPGDHPARPRRTGPIVRELNQLSGLLDRKVDALASWAQPR
jgi:MFS family permease